MPKTFEEKVKLNPSYGSLADYDYSHLYPDVIDQFAIMGKHQPTTPLWYFLDDERPLPDYPKRHWGIFRTGEAMIEAISRYGLPDGISFDHDLGEQIMTGHDVAKVLIEMRLDGKLIIPTTFAFTVHSANPVGAKHIHDCMNDLMRLGIDESYANA